MGERPTRRVRTATSSKLVVGVLFVTFFAMLGAIYLVIKTGKV